MFTEPYSSLDMAFVIACLDKAMDFVLAGAGAAKKGVAKVPGYAPSTEQGQNTEMFLTLS